MLLGSSGRTEMTDNDFYKGKRIFVPGHTGFKGAWFCRILTIMGISVTSTETAMPIAWCRLSA